MCGIVVVDGPAPDRARFRAMLAAIRTRGEVEETATTDAVLIGVQRLRIVDRDRAVQPWRSADGRWALSYNGEVFNFKELRAELLAAGRRLRTESDTEVVLEAFLTWGDAAPARLRGEFAFAVTDTATGRVFLARDALGVKPLYWCRADRHLYVASEVKALVPIGVRVWEVPPGYCGWGAPDLDPALEAYVDLLHLGDDEPVLHDADEAARLLRSTLEDSIRCRLDTDLTVGVVLSGGLDSSITLLETARRHPDCVAFTIGTPDSEDVLYATRLAADLGIEHEVIEVRPRDFGRPQVRETIRVSELTEYGDIINAVISDRLFQRIHRRGIKVVLSGDGSDELFGGYEILREIDEAARQRLFQHLVWSLCRTELQRVDRMSMAHGVEVRVPFLDLAVVRLALRMPIDLKVRDGQEKWIVRQAFADLLPEYIRRRPKNPLSYSSGIHERIRLFRPLFPRYYKACGYRLAGGLRRDFWYALEQSGMDLDRALAEERAEIDLTPWEHARDLAGAVRWNCARALRPPRPHSAQALAALGPLPGGPWVDG